MDTQTLDKTTLTTISLLEARLLRIEQLLYGTTSSSAPTPKKPQPDSALSSLADLERRLSALVSRSRVYADILKLCKPPPPKKRSRSTALLSDAHAIPNKPDRSHPTFFTSPSSSDPLPPAQLDVAAQRATVLSFASAFPGTVSALTAVTSDVPVPDPALSAELAALLPRMKGLEAVQLAQEAEVAALRARSEAVVRRWCEAQVVRYGGFVADVEGRVEGVERAVRRAERAREAEGV